MAYNHQTIITKRYVRKLAFNFPSSIFNRSSSALLQFVFTCFIFITSTISHAQVENNDNNDNNDLDFSIENMFSLVDIIVTAQKKTESMQDTPISLSVFNSNDLEKLGANNAYDIGAYAPNSFIIRTMGGNNNMAATFRGIGMAETSLAIDPKVGLYLDGVYIARNVGSLFDILDIERIEILRGPQGTLWGKNTTGGAINIITQKPSGELNIKQKLSVGSDGFYLSRSTFHLTKTADVSTMFSLIKKNEDGWGTNTSNNVNGHTELGKQVSESLRFSTLWEPSDSFSLNYIYNKVNGASTPIPTQISSVSADTSSSITTTFIERFSDPHNVNVYALMEAYASLENRQEVFDLDLHGSQNSDLDSHSLTINWVRGDLNFKSISAYREYFIDIGIGVNMSGANYTAGDGDTTLFPTFHSIGITSHHQFSQEFLTVGDIFDEQLSFVLGLYFFSESGEDYNPWLAVMTQVPILNTNLILNDLGSFYIAESRSSALFSHVTYHLDEQWDITLGLRYTHDNRTVYLQPTDPIIDEQESASKSWNKFTKTLTVTYKWSEDVMFYGKRAEGYAAGVFNPAGIDRNPLTDITTEIALTPAEPEGLTSYELGAKSMLMDSRVRFNTAYFYANNKNIQLSDLIDTVRTIYNSGTTITQGVELELNALLQDGLAINFTYGYVNMIYDVVGDTNNDGVDDQFFQTTPENTASIGLEYERPFYRNGLISFNINATYRDSIGLNFDSLFKSSEPLTLLNTRISIKDIPLGTGELTAALWCKNLLDEEYRAHSVNLGDYTAAAWGDPRSIGLGATWSF